MSNEILSGGSIDQEASLDLLINKPNFSNLERILNYILDLETWHPVPEYTEIVENDDYFTLNVYKKDGFAELQTHTFSQDTVIELLQEFFNSFSDYENAITNFLEVTPELMFELNEGNNKLYLGVNFSGEIVLSETALLFNFWYIDVDCNNETFTFNEIKDYREIALDFNYALDKVHDRTKAFTSVNRTIEDVNTSVDESFLVFDWENVLNEEGKNLLYFSKANEFPSNPINGTKVFREDLNRKYIFVEDVWIEII